MKSGTGLTAVFAAAFLISCMTVESLASETKQKVLRVSGSDNVSRFVQAYAKDYMQENGDKTIVVTGGKPSTGFRDLFEGRAEVVMAARKMDTSEEETARSKGMQVTGKQIGWCAIMIVTHPANPVAALDVDQVTKIFKGEYTNWNQVGGTDKEIAVIAVDDKDFGPVLFFTENVLRESPYSTRISTMSQFQTVLAKVLETEGSIAFCRVTDMERRQQRGKTSGHGSSHTSTGARDGQSTLPKVLSIKKTPDTPAVMPPTHTDHAAAHGASSGEPYPLLYPLFLYWDANRKDAFTEDFIEYSVRRGMGNSAGHRKGH